MYERRTIMLKSLKNKTVLITGAGSGIGKTLAIALAKEGMNVVLFGGRRVNKLEETKELVEQYSKCIMLPGDIIDGMLKEAMIDYIDLGFLLKKSIIIIIMQESLKIIERIHISFFCEFIVLVTDEIYHFICEFAVIMNGIHIMIKINDMFRFLRKEI